MSDAGTDVTRSERPVDSGSDHSYESDEHDLVASLADLAALVSGSMPLADLLESVARYAVQAIPNADGAGITLLEPDRDDDLVHALAASAGFVNKIDEIQYHITKEGPCVTAARLHESVLTGNVSADPRWPRFGPRIGRLGVHSVLSLPLMVDGHAIGVVNAYAHARDVFDNHAVRLGEAFAAPAAVAVHNAHVLSQAQTQAAQLQAALLSRPTIDQAIGIIRARAGGSADEAFAKLRTISQRENVKLVAVAQRIVDEAVRRAHARHTSARKDEDEDE